MCSIPTGTAKEKKYSKKENISSNLEYDNYREYQEYQEKRLKSILSSIEGISNVKVMITVEEGVEKVVLKEEPYSEKNIEEYDSSGGKRNTNEKNCEEKVVMYSDSDGGDIPYVIKEKAPKIQGVAVVADGVKNSDKKSEVIAIIESLFSLPAHKITVIESSTLNK